MNLDTLSSDNSAEMSESWRVFQSLIVWGKKLFHIGILTGRGNLKNHLVLIPATPVLWDKVICRDSGSTFLTFYGLMSLYGTKGLGISIMHFYAVAVII